MQEKLKKKPQKTKKKNKTKTKNKKKQNKQKQKQNKNKQTIEHKGYGDTNCNWYKWNNLQRLMRGLEIRKQEETIQTTTLLRPARILRRVLEDLRKLAVTQIPMRNH